LGGINSMKTWHIGLVGAVGGPLVGLPVTFATKPSTDSVFFYPVMRSMFFLSRILFPNQDMAGVVLFLPLLLLYFALIGVLFALIGTFFWKKVSA
jgi:hypothetical protein